MRPGGERCRARAARVRSEGSERCALAEGRGRHATGGMTSRGQQWDFVVRSVARRAAASGISPGEAQHNDIGPDDPAGALNEAMPRARPLRRAVPIEHEAACILSRARGHVAQHQSAPVVHGVGTRRATHRGRANHRAGASPSQPFLRAARLGPAFTAAARVKQASVYGNTWLRRVCYLRGRLHYCPASSVADAWPGRTVCLDPAVSTTPQSRFSWQAHAAAMQAGRSAHAHADVSRPLCTPSRRM